MNLRNLQVAGATPTPLEFAGLEYLAGRHARCEIVIGAVAFGVLAGIAASAYWWKQRARTLQLNASPFEKAEELISSCENKIADIERAIEELKEAAR